MTNDLTYDQALAQYSGTIRTFARNCVKQLPSFDVEDVEQELRIILWKCVERYDASKGAKFNTLFQGCARNRVITMVRAAQAAKRTAILTSLDNEDLAYQVEGMITDGSAEEWYFAMAEHGSRFTQELRSITS